MSIPLYDQVTLGTQRRSMRAGEFTFTLCEHAANLSLAPHGHSRLSVCHVIEGGYVEGGLRNRESDCPPGAITIKMPGQEHWNRVGSGGCLSLAIEIDTDRLDYYSDLLPPLGRIGVSTHPRANAIAHGLHRELQYGELVCPLVLEETARDLIFVLASRRRAVRFGRPDWLQRVRDLLHSDELCYGGLEDLAHRVGVHHVHLARVFRRWFGMSVGSYLRSVRVDRARNLLRDSDRPIAEIASTIGFADQAHLTRVFRRATGTTPAAFRRQNLCRISTLSSRWQRGPRRPSVT